MSNPEPTDEPEKKEISVETWEECEDEIQKIEERYGEAKSGLWFRGLASVKWKLETTLERRTRGLASVLDYYRLISRVKPEIETYTDLTWEVPDYATLKSWAKTYETIEVPPAYSYLAYLRHHGFPSPLLDWTRSAYVAAYFAFSRPRGDRVAIYLYLERPNRFKTGGSDGPAIIALGPYVKTHKRHFRQQSRYTYCAQFENGTWHFKPHQAVFDLGQSSQDLLWKIEVPSSERMKILSLLDKFNLNAFSLFDSEESLMETLAFREIDLKTMP